MPIAIEQTLQALQIIVQSVPVGTNLSLIHLMSGYAITIPCDCPYFLRFLTVTQQLRVECDRADLTGSKYW